MLPKPASSFSMKILKLQNTKEHLVVFLVYGRHYFNISSFLAALKPAPAVKLANNPH